MNFDNSLSAQFGSNFAEDIHPPSAAKDSQDGFEV